MAKILLIETATDVCSVAVAVNGTPVSVFETRDTLDHAALLTLHIQECIKQSGLSLAALDAIALSGGPGSYTALRVGSSVAKGICYALDKPLIAVNTLEALAEGGRWWWVEGGGLKVEGESENSLAPGLENTAPATRHPLPLSIYFVPMLDARRQEVWTAVFDASGARISPDTSLILENNLFVNFVRGYVPDHSTSKFYIFGNGMDKAQKVFLHEGAAFCQVEHTSAVYLTKLAENAFHKEDFQNISYFEPFYMKPPNITTASKIF
jgi:tRNA threonylcarbamoyladenosine biosynthesis protein TsaB